MITTFLQAGAGNLASMLAANLAVLRARSGKRVQVLDTRDGHPAAAWSTRRAMARLWPRVAVQAGQEGGLARMVEMLGARGGDMLIDAGRRDMTSSLIMAQTAVVLAELDDNLGAAAPALIEQARLFNPGLRVLVLGVARAPCADDASVRGLAALIRAARPLGTLRLNGALNEAFAAGAAACDRQPPTHPACAALSWLCEEVYEDRGEARQAVGIRGAAALRGIW
ncbi:MAG TPA: hypothetical protein VFF16_09060 [Telluria sp.]|nr:hypothetical protein [Telluria sp.]